MKTLALWTAVAKRSDDTAFATHRTSSGLRKRRRVRLAGAVHNLTDLPAAPMIAKHPGVRQPLPLSPNSRFQNAGSPSPKNISKLVA